jgi:cyclopropane-fatty-acyl-phospholipid synthase
MTNSTIVFSYADSSLASLINKYVGEAQCKWTSAKPYRPTLLIKILLRMANAIQTGTCHIIFPDGAVRTLIGKNNPDSVEAICILHNDKFAWKFLVRGMLGFCEAYLDGDWESPDVTKLFLFALYNEQALLSLTDGRGWWRRIEGFLHNFRRNSKQGSKKNIAYHYDLGNEFYAKWLDQSMTYSAALFPSQPSDNDSLFEAQQNKYRNVAAMLGLEAHHHILEIGCGWGGFAEYAAREIGCRVTGLTISKEQHAYSSERIAKAGLSNKVDIQLCDYRDSKGLFDRIVSIEMFEAVGEQYWPQFFATMRDRLRPGGMAAMQVITIAKQNFNTYRRGADYIQKYIFPGGLLPTFDHLREHVGKACMQWSGDQVFGQDYARTLLEWRMRFREAWPNIAPMGFDEKFRRMWDQYLCYCEAGFRAGTIDVCQFSFTKPLTTE